MTLFASASLRRSGGMVRKSARGSTTHRPPTGATWVATCSTIVRHLLRDATRGRGIIRREGCSVLADCMRRMGWSIVAFLSAIHPSAAEPGHPTVGAVQVLAHLKNYDLHGSHPEFDPYANPAVECAARDGDQIVVSASRILMWIDGTTRAIVRKLAIPPVPGGDCKLALFKR